MALQNLGKVLNELRHLFSVSSDVRIHFMNSTASGFVIKFNSFKTFLSSTDAKYTFIEEKAWMLTFSYHWLYLHFNIAFLHMRTI